MFVCMYAKLWMGVISSGLLTLGGLTLGIRKVGLSHVVGMGTPGSMRCRNLTRLPCLWPLLHYLLHCRPPSPPMSPPPPRRSARCVASSPPTLPRATGKQHSIHTFQYCLLISMIGMYVCMYVCMYRRACSNAGNPSLGQVHKCDTCLSYQCIDWTAGRLVTLTPSINTCAALTFLLNLSHY